MRLFEGTPFDIPPTCDRCGKLETECQCPPLPAGTPRWEPGKQTARVAVEKRKRGKTVTVVRGLSADGGNHVADVLVRLKNACGAGGTIKDGAIEIQGEHRDRITDLLRQLGYQVR